MIRSVYEARLKHHDLIRHLEAHGYRLIREGGRHSVFYSEAIQRTSTVPRHREIKNPTALKICKDLGVPNPLR